MRVTHFLTEENRKFLQSMGILLKPWHVVFEKLAPGVYTTYSYPNSNMATFRL